MSITDRLRRPTVPTRTLRAWVARAPLIAVALAAVPVRASDWTDENDREESVSEVNAFEEGHARSRTPGDDDGDPDEVVDEEEEALALSVAWPAEDAGVVWPEIEVAAPDTEGLAYVLQYRLRFAGAEISWEDGPFEAVALQVFTTGIDIPSDAYVSTLQEKYPSDLTVQVLALDAEGYVLRAVQAEPLKVMWSEPGATPSMMRRDEWVARSASYGAAETAWDDVNVEWVPADIESE